ncbi:MAG: universal stress protein [Microvirga sp.]|nr:universal stress protein [Microvirga sp.]
MLKGAEDVRLVLVDPIVGTEAQGAEPGADAASYLARHGVKVTVDRIPSLGRAVADALKCYATDYAAELLVKGAYGHSRLRERIFGGVTRPMIEEPTLPTFMLR